MAIPACKWRRGLDAGQELLSQSLIHVPPLRFGIAYSNFRMLQGKSAICRAYLRSAPALFWSSKCKQNPRKVRVLLLQNLSSGAGDCSSRSCSLGIGTVANSAAAHASTVSLRCRISSRRRQSTCQKSTSYQSCFFFFFFFCTQTDHAVRRNFRLLEF